MNTVLLEDYLNILYGLLEQEDVAPEEVPVDPKTDVDVVAGVKPGKVPISREDLIKILKGTRGKILTIAYRKKDGTLRLLNAMTGVRKNITGAGLKYDPEKYGYIILYDLKKKGYRTVNINTVGDVKMDKQVYTVTEALNKFPLPFKHAGISVQGETAWKHWKYWLSINRYNKFVSDVLDSIQRQGYMVTPKQLDVLVRWFNSKR